MSARERLVEAITAGDRAEAERLVVADPRLAEAREHEPVSPVLLACYHRRDEIRDLLIAAGHPLTLHEAAAAGRLERLAELLDHAPARVDEFAPDGFWPLGLAAFFGQHAAVEALIARGADINLKARNAVGVAALHAAIAGGHLAIVETLVRAGADVNARQQGGYTPLHGAASGDLAGAVDVLLAHGAEPSARSDDGKTPADVARERGHAALAERLRRHAP
ncbi:MAG: ankyrin repeat domain-containing protein [Acidobacteriota bacterium]